MKNRSVKIPLFWLCVFYLCFFNFSFVKAEVLSSTELIRAAMQHDGKKVIYAGEAIGQKLNRGNFCWINVHDGKQAIGIWLPKNLAEQIQYFGGYKIQGDYIEIEGIFHRACLEHGGDLDIHAEEIRKIRPGYKKEEKLNLDRRKLVLQLGGVLCLVWILSLFKHRQKKR